MGAVGSTLLLVGCGQESPSSDDDDGRSEPEEVQEIDEEEAFVSIDCDAWQNAPPEPRGCVNQPIYCNDEIESTTFGSTSKLGDDFYLQAGVTPRGHSYQESGDVVYELLLPGDTDAVLSLDTPCADLDLFAMTYRDGSQQCPSSTTVFKESDFSQRRSELEELKISTGSLGREDRMQGGRSYLVVIDGKSAQEVIGSRLIALIMAPVRWVPDLFGGTRTVQSKGNTASGRVENPARCGSQDPSNRTDQITKSNHSNDPRDVGGSVQRRAHLERRSPISNGEGLMWEKNIFQHGSGGQSVQLGEGVCGDFLYAQFHRRWTRQAKVAFTYSGRPLTCTGVATTMQCR